MLAQILGRRITEEDLVVKFNAFVRDWDEVRLGTLKNLYEFLRVLSPTARKIYLPLLYGFKEVCW